jgi:hypothetical protein
MRAFIIFIHHKILMELLIQDDGDRPNKLVQEVTTSDLLLVGIPVSKLSLDIKYPEGFL